MRAITTLLVAAMLAGQAEGVIINEQELPAKLFFYRDADALPLEVKSFRPTAWAQIGPGDPWVDPYWVLTLGTADGQPHHPTYTGVSGDHYVVFDVGQGSEHPGSGWSATMAYDFSFETHTGGPPFWRQSTETILALLPLASITFDPGGRIPGGTYAGGVMVPWTTGDLNGDDTIDAGDAAVAFANWGMAGVSDLNGDGITDAADAGAIFEAWTGDAIVVPEPGLHWVLLALLIPGYRSRRSVRRRAAIV